MTAACEQVSHVPCAGSLEEPSPASCLAVSCQDDVPALACDEEEVAEASTEGPSCHEQNVRTSTILAAGVTVATWGASLFPTIYRSSHGKQRDLPVEHVLEKVSMGTSEDKDEAGSWTLVEVATCDSQRNRHKQEVRSFFL